MRRIMTAIFVILFMSSGLKAGGGIFVVATTPDLGAIAREVIGGAGEVYVIARPDQSPHYVQAKPSHMIKMRKADAVIYTGLELEITWLPKLLGGARNPSLMPGKPGNLNAAAPIKRILEVPTGEIDRSGGDIHPMGNPHYLLDPRNGVIVAKWMAGEFARIDPGNASAYKFNAERFTSDLENRIEGWSKHIQSIKGSKIIAYHKQWEYLADWLGIELVGYIEDRPGIPPSPKHIMALEGLIKKEKIGVIIKANNVPSQAPEKLAARTGIKAVILPATVTGRDGVESYSDMFEAIINRLTKVPL